MQQENRFLQTVCFIDTNNVMNALLDHEKIIELLKARYVDSEEDKKRFKVSQST